MQLTNNYGLPQPIFDAIANDEYDRGESDITVTQLLSPPRQVELIRTHPELEEDASDRLYSLDGQAFHTIFERADNTAQVEERVYATVNGWKVGGKFDRFSDGVLQDYKRVKVDEYRMGLKIEREQQLNSLAYLLRENGHAVYSVEAICLFRDWSKVRAANDPTYPKVGWALVELPLWSHDRARAFLEERVRLHQDAHHELPNCTDFAMAGRENEQWQGADVWAVMKEGRKSAVQLCDWEVEANLAAESLNATKGKGHYVAHRPGTRNRCLYYCSAAPVCEQFKAVLDA